MSEYDNALKQLKQMHKILLEKNLNTYTLSRSMCEAMEHDDYNEMVRNFNFIEDEGWIIKKGGSKDRPISYALTSTGIKRLENIIEKPVIQQNTYHVGVANNSIIGDHAHDNIINIGASFDELKSLIEQNFSNQVEKNEILAILKNLQDRLSSNQPLEKGILSKINDKIESCSWLSSSIVPIIIQYLTHS
ncbi:DNA-binding PadR family transcriptional regulator [Sporomusaceae bacterium BoRhaA]|uniref:hypothetical protein n=1 Tax=Pelorhabdus rhamnosifermentans TaxID=2772457 RepID=UPI001C063BDE|nr:hypothetical protein [Pelorhabdus rhamnosifermentans]MBU2703869.1 DNA-binding PadR family transcriptional regulator [Pelorhabdus rhamnosifermentans]